MREAVNINLGLLALKKCIESLNNRSSYTPYQDSKLTMLLSQGLGGERVYLSLYLACCGWDLICEDDRQSLVDYLLVCPCYISYLIYSSLTCPQVTPRPQ